MFSTFPLCSQLTIVFYHSHGLGFLIFKKKSTNAIIVRVAKKGRKLTHITNGELEKLRLNFLRCANWDVVV